MKGLRWMIFALACGLLGLQLIGFAVWLASLFALTGMVFLGLFVWEVFPRRIDPYSIDALRRVSEREEVRKLLEEEPSIADEAEIVCPHCLRQFPGRFRKCPYCHS
jgi:hypothetical protein